MKHKAISLVELMIYLAITALVLVVVIDLVARVTQQQTAGVGQGNVNANARFLSNRLTYAIEKASSIEGSYPADDLHLLIDGANVDFTLSDGKVLYQEGIASALPLTESSVSILPPEGENIFTRITNGTSETIQIRYRIRYNQNNYERDFQTSVLRRGR